MPFWVDWSWFKCLISRLKMSKKLCSCQNTPGVRFSKDPKTSRARKPSRKPPETTFGCFSKHPKNFEPEKYVIFPRKFHGYSLPPEKRSQVCFSCTCLKWYNDKKIIPFFLLIFKAYSFNIQLAKFWASRFIRRLFILSVSFGFDGLPLLTFKTDR